MSKGNSYWGTARGKIGNIVVSTNKGERIERKYQPTVANPRTRNQMLQRARFANAVKFYKRAYANFFRFAYEDKKQRESDFNAYMRHNTNQRMSVLKKSQVDGTFPAVCENVLLTAGSLGHPYLVDARGTNPYLALPSLESAVSTIGNVSKALIADFGLEDGDIITIVRVTTSVTSLTQANPAQNPIWGISQFIVNSSSDIELSSVSENLNVIEGKGLGVNATAATGAIWNAICFSRKNTNRVLQVSNSSLVANAAAYQLYIAAAQTAWINTALTSWNASADAVLEGSLVDSTLQNVVFSEINGNAVPYVSSLSFDSGVTSKVTLVGTGFSSLKVSAFKFDGGTVDGLTVSSDTEAELALTGNGSHPSTWTLTYNGTVIARHSDVTAVITSVSPAKVNKLTSGQTATFIVTGTNVDALSKTTLISSNTNLAVTSVTTTATQTTVVVTANADVSDATISYDGTAIFTVKEAAVAISSPTTQDITAGTSTLTVGGTDLDYLTADSFTVTDGIEIVSYTPGSDGTKADVIISATKSGTISYGTWSCALNVTKSGGE